MALTSNSINLISRAMAKEIENLGNIDLHSYIADMMEIMCEMASEKGYVKQDFGWSGYCERLHREKNNA